MAGSRSSTPGLPEVIPYKRSHIDPLLKPVQAFMAAESAGGILLLLAAVTAMVWANSTWGDAYYAFWHAKAGVAFGDYSFKMSLEHWVNDGLMVIFFLVVGLEIKRELLTGELASLKKASLPVAAALGGMIVPAGIYFALNAGGPGAKGWGIPMATDIAFAVGVVALVGRSLPIAVKVFLLAIAIVDDLGAVLVIAVFYTSKISLPALGVAGGFFAALVLLNLLRVHRPAPYLLIGVGFWIATLFSGIHATVAGVLLAFCIPASRQIEEIGYMEYVSKMLKHFERDATSVPDAITEEQSHALHSIEHATEAVQTPLARVEHAWLKIVSFVIVPIFALANAGVDLRHGAGAATESAITWGVALGLLLGKPIGILLLSWIAIRSGIASLPAGGTWKQVVGVSLLCGIGFTMSLFVANLAFPGSPTLLGETKVGILAASLLSGVIGALVIRSASKRPTLSL